CYVGQELTIRTHHTGVVRKRILPVQLYSPEDAEPTQLEYNPQDAMPSPPSGTDIKKAEGRGRSTGKFLTDEPSSFKPGTEFKMRWERDANAGGEGEGEAKEGMGRQEEVKIKAFVPGWWKGRERIRGPLKRVE
ncbi:hypothetical protein LTS18_014051, partial [Coniosporium uncinatum]